MEAVRRLVATPEWISYLMYILVLGFVVVAAASLTCGSGGTVIL